MGEYKGERLQVVIPAADFERLMAQYHDLQARRVLSQRVTFNQWLVRLAIERAGQLETSS